MSIKSKLLAFGLMLVGGTLAAQNYNMPSGAGVASYATTCSGTLRDDGGTGNYSNGQNSSYTFYPSTAGQYMRITITAFNTQATADYLSIYDGPGGPLIAQYSGTPTVPFTITASASNSTRGLTFRFRTNGNNVSSGFQGTLSCTATAGAAPAFTPNAQDCQQGGGTTICSNANLTANSGGGGNVSDLANPWDGCLSGGENQSSWYYFSPSSSGTVGFTIAPANGTDDYDFALWGPFSNVQCPVNTTQPPLRCSYSGLGGNTGCGNGATDVSEGAGGDKWVQTFPVTAGDVYVMVIDNYLSSSNPFTLTWNLTAGANLNCTVLPIELISFTGHEEDDYNVLQWQTGTEIDNDYFAIERSVNGGAWDSIGTVDGAGNSTQVLDYEYHDYDLYDGIAYYRLRQRDYNGFSTVSQIIYIVRSPKVGGVTTVYPVPTQGDLTVEYNTAFESTVTVDVTAAGGKVVYSQQVAVVPGKNLISIDLAGEAGGLYNVQVRDNTTGTSTVNRVVLSKD